MIRRYPFHIIPLALFFLFVIFLWHGLQVEKKQMPSALITQPVPKFSLSTVLDPKIKFSSDDLKGHISLVNVWATWCAACQIEHPVLMDIAQDKQVRIYGLNYKDKIDAARKWLKEFGNPYNKSGFDADGKVSIDWGVFGAPETFIVDSKGIIRYRYVGPVTKQTWNLTLLPLIRSLEALDKNKNSLKK